MRTGERFHLAIDYNGTDLRGLNGSLTYVSSEGETVDVEGLSCRIPTLEP